MPMENETREQRQKQELDNDLNRQLEQTFPTSDPSKVTRSISATKSRRSRDPGDEQKTS